MDLFLESDNRRIFETRLQRIAEHARSRTQILHAGEGLSFVVPLRKRKPRHGLGATLLRMVWYPLSAVLALMLGMASHLLGMVLRFYVHGLNGWSPDPDIDAVAQVVLGFALAVVLGYLTGFGAARLTGIKVVGVVAGVLLYHNAVHLFPQAFAQITSPPWVSQVMTQTKANSLIWRGICIPF